MIRACVSVKRIILINDNKRKKTFHLKCFCCLEFKFYVMQGRWLRTLIYNTTKMKEAPWQQEVNSGFTPKQLRAIFTSIFLIRKNVHKVQNIIRITNKKEKQMEKRTEKYCRKERTYTWTNSSDFAWSLMKQALEILRHDRKHPFSLFILLQFLKNLTGDRSLLDWDNVWMLQQERQLFFPLKFSGILKKITPWMLLLFVNDNLPHSLPARQFSRVRGCHKNRNIIRFQPK